MSRYLAVLLLLPFANAAFAQEPAEPLVKKVKNSIARGVDYLASKQAKDGGWAVVVDDQKSDWSGGATALAVLALLNCDGVIDDRDLDARRKQAIADGLANLRRIKDPTTTYVRALQTMAFAEARTDRPIIEANVDWLIKARVFHDGEFVGWSYYADPKARAVDGSNTQYAMLALWYARQAGVPVPREVWQKIFDHYRRTQTNDGAWAYSPHYDRKDLKTASLTMTIAGLCGLQIAGMELDAGPGQPLPSGALQELRHLHRRRQHRQRPRVDQQALHARSPRSQSTTTFTASNGPADSPAGASSASMTGTARAANSSSNARNRGARSRPASCTIRGRTSTPASPCSFSRRGEPPSSSASWFTATGRARRTRPTGTTTATTCACSPSTSPRGTCSAKKRSPGKPMTFAGPSKAHLDKNRSLSAAEEAAIVADMLQSPILYLSGHGSVAAPGQFQDVELKLIKRYIENGGFIVAEACCGSKAFDAGIKEWVKQLWPDSDLEYLTSDHPVWTCWNRVSPGDPYRLMGLQVGCRTVMIYSPQDLRGDGRRELGFRMGENLIAYATGRTPPEPRLTEITIASPEKEDATTTKRGELRVGQIRISSNASKWQPAPKAMRILLEHVHDIHGLEVNLRTDPPVDFAGQLKAIKFLYMHGKDEIRFNKEKIEALRFNLSNGGLLLADACCGSDAFDREFRKFAQELFPKEKLTLLSTDPLNRDRLYGEELNGKDNALSRNTIKCRTKASGPMEAMEPHLEGIKIGGRWVVLYSKYDLGCALERSTAGDCRGYDHASALRIATAAVLYNARP